MIDVLLHARSGQHPDCDAINHVIRRGTDMHFTAHGKKALRRHIPRNCTTIGGEASLIWQQELAARRTHTACARPRKRPARCVQLLRVLPPRVWLTRQAHAQQARAAGCGRGVATGFTICDARPRSDGCAPGVMLKYSPPAPNFEAVPGSYPVGRTKRNSQGDPRRSRMETYTMGRSKILDLWLRQQTAVAPRPRKDGRLRNERSLRTV